MHIGNLRHWQQPRPNLPGCLQTVRSARLQAEPPAALRTPNSVGKSGAAKLLSRGEAMKHSCWLLVVILGSLLVAQTNLKSPLPLSCTPGDYVDAYSGGSECRAKDKWVTTQGCDSLKAFEQQGGISLSMGDASSLPWRPDCTAAFQDDQKTWHCPWETASGRVVGCIPCDGRHKQSASCHIWYNRCLRLVDAMKKYSTVEASTVDIPQDQQTDRSAKYHWTCPVDYRIDYLGEHNAWDAPLCVK